MRLTARHEPNWIWDPGRVHWWYAWWELDAEDMKLGTARRKSLNPETPANIYTDGELPTCWQPAAVRIVECLGPSGVGI